MPEQQSQEGQPLEFNALSAPPPLPTVASSTPLAKAALKHKLSRRAVITGLATLGVVSVSGGITWWVLTPHPLYTYRGHSGSVNAVMWSPDGKRIASGSDDHTVQVWDVADGAHVFTYKGHFKWVDALAWSPDGKRIASGGGDSTVQVWDAADGSHVFTYNLYFNDVNTVAWSPDGKRIALGSEDYTVQVWDAK